MLGLHHRWPKGTVFLDPKDAGHRATMKVFGLIPNETDGVYDGTWYVEKEGQYAHNRIDASYRPIPLHIAVRICHEWVMQQAEFKRIKAMRSLFLPLLGLNVNEDMRGNESLEVTDTSEPTISW